MQLDVTKMLKKYASTMLAVNVGKDGCPPVTLASAFKELAQLIGVPSLSWVALTSPRGSVNWTASILAGLADVDITKLDSLRSSSACDLLSLFDCGLPLHEDVIDGGPLSVALLLPKLLIMFKAAACIDTADPAARGPDAEDVQILTDVTTVTQDLDKYDILRRVLIEGLAPTSITDDEEVSPYYCGIGEPLKAAAAAFFDRISAVVVGHAQTHIDQCMKACSCVGIEPAVT